jgi:hypothetical protein
MKNLLPRCDLEQYYGQPVESWEDGGYVHYFSNGVEIGRLSFAPALTQNFFDREIEFMKQLRSGQIPGTYEPTGGLT